MDSKDFAHSASDLTDEEITQTFKVVEQVRRRYAMRNNSVENLDALRDEVLTRLAEINILATMDVAPCFYGQPPEIEIVGKISGDSIHKYGMDHEKKQTEVRKAVATNQDWLGQKEPVNKRRKK